VTSLRTSAREANQALVGLVPLVTPLIDGMPHILNMALNYQPCGTKYSVPSVQRVHQACALLPMWTKTWYKGIVSTPVWDITCPKIDHHACAVTQIHSFYI